MRIFAGTFAVALMVLSPLSVSTAMDSPSTALVRSSAVTATATLRRCDEQGLMACRATCPFDTVENYEACSYQCEVFYGCA